MARTLAPDWRAFGIACGQIDIGNAFTDMSEGQTKGVPQADGKTAFEPKFDVSHVADSIYSMAELPPSANIQFMTIMATGMPYIGRG